MIGLLMFLACKEPLDVKAASAAAAAVQTAPVEVASWVPHVEVTGSVEPVALVQLGFDVPGRIETLLVHRGQSVHAGDAIARLDSRMAQAQLAQASAALAGAKAQLGAAELSLGRLEQLKAAGGVSEQQYTDVKAQIEAGRAGVQQAEAAVRLASVNLDWHTLRSPITGVVTNGPDNAGILVGAGTPMFVIEDLSSLQLKGTVGEDAPWVAEGQKAILKAGSPGQEISSEAEVVRVIASLDMATRRIPVELKLVNPPASLKAHGFATATIEGNQPLSVFSVPANALTARPDFCVFVEGNPKPERVQVTVLKREEGKVLVQGALTAGAKVVLDPAYSLGAE